MYYSPETNGFYDPLIHAESIPEDAKSISVQLYRDLILAQENGALIKAGKDGLPFAEEPSPRKITKEDIERARLIAYADKLTGSDRFYIEAAAERLEGNEEKAQAAEEKMRLRRAEIAAEYPWPDGE